MEKSALKTQESITDKPPVVEEIKKHELNKNFNANFWSNQVETTKKLSTTVSKKFTNDLNQ